MKTRTIALAAAVLLSGLTLGGAVALASDERGVEGSPERHREQRGREEGDGDHEGEHKERHAGRGAATVDPAYAKECGACHLAYPPSMLPAGSWRTMLGSLERHFGQDAELDDAARARLEAWLVARAGPGDGAPQRITGLAWFRDEHRELPAGVASRPAVRSLANCGACHPAAAGWDFDEHQARIPR